MAQPGDQGLADIIPAPVSASRIGLWALHHPRSGLALVAVIVALVAGFGIPRIKVDGDLYDLLPAGDPRVRAMIELLEDAGASSRMVLAIEADTAPAIEAAGAAVLRFLERVRADPRIRRVERGLVPGTLAALAEPTSLLLLEGPARARLLALLTPAGLTARALELAARLADADSVAVRDALLADALGLGELAFLWLRPQGQAGLGQPLPDGTMPMRSPDGRVLVAFAYPTFPGANVPASTELCRDLRELARLELEPHGLRLGLTGSHAIGVEMAALIRADVIASTLDSALTVAAVFYLFYRSAFLVLIVFVPLILVALLTAGVVGLVAGKVHVLTAAAGALIFGLGDDLFIHYLSSLWSQAGTTPALERNQHALREVSRPTLLSVLTTAGAFAALLLSGFPGFAELGWVMAVGMGLFYLVAMVVLPALFARHAPVRSYRRDWFERGTEWLGERVLGRDHWVTPAALVLLGVALAVVVWPPAGLRITTEFGAYEAKVEGFRVRDRLGAAFGSVREPWIVAVDGATLEETLARNDALFTRLCPVLPEFLGGASLRSARFHIAAPATLAANQAALAGVDAEQLGGHFTAELVAVGFEAEWSRDQGRRLTALVTSGAHTAPAIPPTGSRRAVVEPFLYQRGSTWRALNLLSTRDGWQQEGDDAPLLGALAGLPGVKVGGPGPLRTVLTPLLGHAGLWLLAGEFGAMLVILAVGHRSLRRALLVILPLATGLALSAALLKLLGIRLGFGNLGVLPLVVGISIDGAIFLANAAREAGSRVGALRRAARPVTVSSFTTITAFGSLVFAAHPGLRELGTTATLSLAMCWLANLLWFAGPPTESSAAARDPYQPRPLSKS